jgi:lysophospholipase L1-like esterase
MSAERKRENIEWIHTVCHEPGATNLPRVLLIGDSITNNYQEYVSEELSGTAYVSTYTSSKCVTDRSFLKELKLMLSDNEYALIQFNNGLHSLGSDLQDMGSAMGEALKLLREEGKGAKIVWASTTPTVNSDNTRLVKEFNAIAAKVMNENNIPTNDLFALMDPMDRKQYWTDNFHHTVEGKKIAAKQVAAVIRDNLQTNTVSSPVLNATASQPGLADAAGGKSEEKMDWTRIYWYDAEKNNLPRVLVIGDSIHDDYQRSVNEALVGTAFLSTYSTSRSFADPLYVKELKYILEEYKSDVVVFNNGLHCNNANPIWKTVFSDIPGWEAGLRRVIQLIRDENNGPKIVWAASAPWNESDGPAEVKELNAIAAKAMKENNIPISDAYSAIKTGPQYNEELVDIIVSTLRKQLGGDTPSGGASTDAGSKAASSLLGPTGSIGNASETNSGQ